MRRSKTICSPVSGDCNGVGNVILPMISEHSNTRNTPILGTLQYSEHSNTRNTPILGTLQYSEHSNTRNTPILGILQHSNTEVQSNTWHSAEKCISMHDGSKHTIPMRPKKLYEISRINVRTILEHQVLRLVWISGQIRTEELPKHLM